MGDAAIRHDLTARGVAADLIDEITESSIEPERVRAVGVARALGGGARAGRTLARKGFDADAIEHALGVVADEARTGVG